GSEPASSSPAEGSHEDRRLLDEQGAAALRLVLAHHVEIEPRDQPVDAPGIAIEPGERPGQLRHPQETDAAAAPAEPGVALKGRQSARDLEQRAGPGGVVLRAGTRVAEVRQHEPFLVTTARQPG